MKRTFFTIAAMCCAVLGFAQNPKATKIEYESGKVMYFEIDAATHTAAVTWNNKVNYEYAPTPEYTGDIKIPATVTYGGENYAVTAIGNYAFNVCDKLTSVTIPSSVKRIGELAFNQATALTSVGFESESQLEVIEKIAFFNTALPSIQLPASLKVIGSYSFGSCTKMTEVTFPANSALDSIQDGAFSATKLTSFTVPASLRFIGSMVFQNTSDLKNFTFADIEHSQLECIAELAFNVSGITAIELPSSLKKIEDGAFYASELATVNFRDNSQLETIERTAFWGTNLSTVNIPSTVKIVGKEAFASCDKLNTVYNYSENVAGFDATAFNDCGAEITMYVPFKPYEQFKALYPEIRMVVDLEVYRKGALESIAEEMKTPNTISDADMERIEIYIATIQSTRNFYTAYSSYNAAMSIINKQKEIEETLARILGSLGTKQEGTAVRLTGSDGKSFIFYAPASVEYIKVKQ